MISASTEALIIHFTGKNTEITDDQRGAVGQTYPIAVR
ncbi:Uncharacterised protein [Yersinia frederiksenii]|nr:Uncharacterised protein [Yersinia frederiksenii]